MNIQQSLQRTSPEQQGIASAAVLQFVEAIESQIHELHSFMLMRHGCVVAEGWWSPYEPKHPHLIFSLSKSFTSTAVGLAVAEGRLSIEDPVLSFFQDEMTGEVNDFMAAMRVKHLLTMSTGQAEDTWSYMVDRADENWVKGFFEVPVRYEPGSHFVYNTGATYMLSAIMQKITGMKLIDYLEPRLFAPLGIENATWTESPQGITAGGIGLCIKTEDIARFGQLYLQKGMWQGQRILDEAWVMEATSSQISNGNDQQSDWAQGYGYQFWRARHGAYRGDGVFGQFCIVMPEQDAVLAITSGIDVFELQPPLDLVWKILLPAMTPTALPDDLPMQDTLVKKLSSLALPMVKGQAPSPFASSVSGRTYRLDENELKLETIGLRFSDSGCAISFKTLAGEETIPCGYETWERGQTTLFNQPLLFNSAVVAAQGAWTAEETFTMLVRLYETPFFHTLAFHFSKEDLMLEIRINISMDSMKPHLLVAYAIAPQDEIR